MFDLSLALVIFFVSLPGIMIAIPRSLKSMMSTIKSKMPEGKTLPPLPVLALVQTLQSVLLVAGLSLVGAIFAPKVGLEAPFFLALSNLSGVGSSLPNPLPVIGLSAAGSAVFLLLYYRVFARWLDDASVTAADSLRNSMGLGSRILYGGIVEEIIMRWGVMSFLAWAAALVFPTELAIWIAIVISGIIFGIAHIPSYVAAGCTKGPRLYTTQIVLNLWAALFFGYLFWQHGLLAAIVSHMLFHLIWFPFDRLNTRHARRSGQPATATAE